MTELRNPYESPESSSWVKDRDDNFDKRGMMSLIAATAILGGIDYWLLDLGFFAVLGPMIMFFALTFWAFIAGTRESSSSVMTRVISSFFVALLAAPCFFALYAYTCTMATMAVGLNWDIHRGVPQGNRLLFGTITALTIGIVGLILFALSYIVPRSLRSRKTHVEKTTGPENDSN